MGLISSGGKNLLDFLELWQVHSTYDGDLRDALWWHRERPFPCELLGGVSGFLSRRCRGLRYCVEWVPVPEDSSPVLTWILGYFWSLPIGVSPRLEWGHARVLSSRARRRKRGSSGCGPDSRASFRVETGMSGNFLSCSKGVKDPLEIPEVRCD